MPERFVDVERLDGRGSVFVAQDLVSGKKVTIKSFRLGGGASWKEHELFEREAATLRSLDHPGVPKLIDVLEEEDGRRLLLLEFVEGQSLDRAVKDGRRISQERLVSITAGLLEILGDLHAHAPPVVHRDIKPQNIILRDDGQVVLVDFGAVAAAPSGETTVGTFGYMAPEQLHGESRPSSDLYALGMTILALANGQEPESLPRRGLTPIVSSELLGERLAAVVSRMVQPDPDARLGQAREAKRLLEVDEAVVALAKRDPSLPQREIDIAAIRKRVNSTSGLSLIEWAVLGSIPLAAVAGVLGLYWLFAAPVALIAGAVWWTRREASTFDERAE